MTAAATTDAAPADIDSAPADVGADRSPPPELSRMRILAAASEIAAEVGYEGTTLSRVTARSGLPVSSVYWFFADKDELLAEVVRHTFASWSATQPTWIQGPANRPWTDGLTANLRTSLHGIAAEPAFLRIGHMLTLQARTTESAARRLFLEIRDGVERSIADWYAANLPADVVGRRPALPRDLAQVTLAATEGLFLAEQIDDGWDADDVVALVVSIVSAALEMA